MKRITANVLIVSGLILLAGSLWLSMMPADGSITRLDARDIKGGVPWCAAVEWHCESTAGCEPLPAITCPAGPDCNDAQTGEPCDCRIGYCWAQSGKSCTNQNTCEDCDLFCDACNGCTQTTYSSCGPGFYDGSCLPDGQGGCDCETGDRAGCGNYPWCTE